VGGAWSKPLQLLQLHQLIKDHKGH
jgi:hypothetical protein